MAGHSKWANIKRQKARVDTKKGKTFAQLSRAIIIAARNGVPDAKGTRSYPAGNFQLRTAIDKAKAAGIPNENIDRAILKGAGKWSNESPLEEVRYEGYGPGGVAILIEAVTDNRNRTAAELRLAFSKNGGNLGETGCVSWMFSQKGVILIEGAVEEELLLEACLEGGADHYEIGDGFAEVFTEIANLDNLNRTLDKNGLRVSESEWRWLPDNYVEVTEPGQAKYLLRLLDTLDSLDDVQSVTSNFEMSDELMDGAG